MKEIILNSLKEFVANRYLLVLVSILILESLIFAIGISFSIHPGLFNPTSHYSAFGYQNIYTDQWYYLFVFVAFGPIVALLHSIIAIKVLVVKGRPLAVMFVWLGISIVFLGWITALAVIG